MGKQSDRIKYTTRRPSKRKFHGNRFTRTDPLQEKENTPSTNESSNPPTVSSSKIEKIATDTPKETDHTVTGYRFVDMEILSKVFAELRCPQCNSDCLKLREIFSKKAGFASCLVVKCNCDLYDREFFTSAECNKSYDINYRVIYSMRTIGQGYSSLEKFTTSMNMPRPMTKSNFNAAVKKVTKVVTDIAISTMVGAADELRTNTEMANAEDILDVGVSCDGTWQRRGYSSLNGTFTAISLDSGKVLDTEVMSRYCKSCKIKEPLRKENIEEYNKWYGKHKKNCQLNHHGSAGAMELVGATRIFSRSISDRKLRYTKYLGDGDSKGYEVVKSIYEEKEMNKLECVGHVQKRVGTRLRNLKKTQKGLGGKGKLTNKIIDKLQNYYGIAIRSNSTVSEMKKAIHATLFHVASSKKNNYHVHCPTGESSWCRFNSDKATGLSTFKAGAGLPLNVIKHVKPIYEDLSKDELLEKCVHGKTQNQNEAFNALVWERVPKATYVSLTTSKFGTFDAVAHFNVGKKSSVLIFEKLGMVPGRYMTKGCTSINRKRLYFARKKWDENARKRRKIIRAKRKSKMDSLEQAEGTVYGPGEF